MNRFIAVAATIGTVSCDLYGYADFYGYSFDTGYKTACQCAKAATAFGAFSWYITLLNSSLIVRLLWLITLILVIRVIYLERSGSVGPNVARDGTEAQKGVQMTDHHMTSNRDPVI